ncbi:MAG: sulfatase [Verrucomicrobiota bacterium]|nr:sulfatase [Verrucomicrobiota bacterium]
MTHLPNHRNILSAKLVTYRALRKWMAGLFFALCTFTGLEAAPAADHTPNFILVLTDDQSWVGTSLQMLEDHPETRSDFYRTPQVERLAAKGMRFTQGYAPAASCCPTRRAIQTGLMPARHEYHRNRSQWTDWYRQQLNIPRMLKIANPRYECAHFGKWDHRYDQISPHQQGYDHSDGTTGNAHGGAKGSGGPAASPDPKRVDTLTDQALHFMQRNHAQKSPFFLQISHYAVHLDIYYREETLAQIRKRPLGTKHPTPTFAAMTEDLDTSIVRIVDLMDALNLWNNTYLILMSDNGGRNTLPGTPPPTIPRNHPLRDGKHSFYEGGIRVPFIVAGPQIKANSVSQVPITGLDILPTLADLAGYPLPLPKTLDGGSLSSLLKTEGLGQVTRNRPYLVFHQAVDRRPTSAIRWGAFKLVKHWETAKLELFNLREDLSENRDLSTTMPERTKRMEEVLLQCLEEVGAETRRTVRKRP